MDDEAKKYDAMKKYYGNFLQSEFPELIQMFENILNVRHWGFQQTFKGVGAQIPPTVVYDSEWCRVRFMLQASDRHDDKTQMTIMYGRLHAPIDQFVITWNGEQCHCWHGLKRALYFLDGLSPREMIERRSRWPDRMEQFEHSRLEQGLKWPQPEWLVRMHSFIWGEYGKRLFELFDIRRPDLWEKFSLFLKEYDKLYEGPPVPVYPPEYKVC